MRRNAVSKFIMGSILLVVSFILSGCESPQKVLSRRMESKILEQAGVNEDSRYKEFLEYESEGILDNSGYYLVNEEVSNNENTGSIHVTFAKNNFTDVEYYYDEERTKKVNTSSCYINPGDSIFAKVEINENAFSSTYGFSEFEVYLYKSNNARTRIAGWGEDFLNSGIVFTVPADFEGTELAVIPKGEYKSRTINLRDYFVDEEGYAINLQGTWLINDEKNNGDSAVISSVENYIISYSYDGDKYYFASAVPDVFYKEDGLVIFNQRESKDTTVDYEVMLRPYLTVSLESSKAKRIEVIVVDKYGAKKIETTTQLTKKNEKYSIPKLQTGDQITINSDIEWPELSNHEEFIYSYTEMLTGDYKYRYSLYIRDMEEAFLFDPDAYSYEHGKVNFYRIEGGARRNILEEESIAPHDRIYFEGESEKGYHLAVEGEQYVEVTNAAETMGKLQRIYFVEDTYQKVVLTQPRTGGVITYKTDNKVIGPSGEIELLSGTEISIEYTPYHGWQDMGLPKVYVVKDKGSGEKQYVFTNVDDAFKENEDHKPELTVVLKESVGKTMQFSFNNGKDINVYPKTFADTKKKEYVLIDALKIGTGEKLKLNVSNGTIDAGKALRVVLEKKVKDSDDVEKEICYLTSSPIETSWDIYNYSNSNEKKSYEKITITIDFIDVLKFKSVSATNMQIIVRRLYGNNAIFMEGDSIDPNEKVDVMLSPNSGYYIKGSKTPLYSEQMKYSDFVKDISKMVEKHPSKLYCTITLDKSDSFANYSYKLDGESVSGTIRAKEGQKLELEYEIVSGNKKILLQKLLFGKDITTSKISKKIAITDDLNGKSITKDDFDITLK